MTQKYGIQLKINDPKFPILTEPVAFDVETDEKDNFVGIAFCYRPDEVYYYTNFELASQIIQHNRLIGHNIKGDLHWCTQWGIAIEYDKIFMDTMIMSYVQNPTKESHGLKQIGKEYLNLEWPKYRDIVGKGRKKLTLDKQPVEVVANYCGMDAVATFRLYQYLLRKLSPTQLSILYNIEMPTLRLLLQMELKGLTINVPYLEELDVKFKSEIEALEIKLQGIADSTKTDTKDRPIFNPRSPKQVVEVARALSIPVSASNKKELAPFKDHPFVASLDAHRGLSKLHSGYIKRFKGLHTLPKVYPEFSQVSVDEVSDSWKGIRTGRLSSDYHNIPRRSEKGSLLRKLFVAPGGNTIICGDYSQIEYRLLAHFTKEPLLIQAFRTGKDVHEETAKMFGSDNRDMGKTLNFAAIYGAQAKKIAFTANISVEEAQRLLDLYWRNLKRVTSWINRVKFEARQKKGVRTLCGRWIPLNDLNSTNQYERWHAERQSVNYIIQGSAADIIKMAMLNCQKKGFIPNLQVHDELLFTVPTEEVQVSLDAIKREMESVVSLEVPLEVDMGSGQNWEEAKS